jgi:hypothetical protein
MPRLAENSQLLTVFFSTTTTTREMDELMAVGEDGKEIISANEMDLDQLRRAEEEGMKEGWWVEKVDHLKEKMERLLKLDLSRYGTGLSSSRWRSSPPHKHTHTHTSSSLTVWVVVVVCGGGGVWCLLTTSTGTSTDSVTTTPFRTLKPRRRNSPSNESGA